MGLKKKPQAILLFFYYFLNFHDLILCVSLNCVNVNLCVLFSLMIL